MEAVFYKFIHNNPQNILSGLAIKIKMTSAYSSTPLARKLGIKEGSRISVLHAPEHYFQLFTDWPDKVELFRRKGKDLHLIHYFATLLDQLIIDLPDLKNSILPHGAIWISWPKKASKQPTDITEDRIRDLAIQNGLVDVKVCAIDEVWSGLKLVIPVGKRGKLGV